MKTTNKVLAVMVDCPGVVNEGKAGHMMRDACWSCAPFWESYPTCPTYKTKLNPTGYCKQCKKFHTIPKEVA